MPTSMDCPTCDGTGRVEATTILNAEARKQ